jgi:hypothetical protein
LIVFGSADMLNYKLNAHGGFTPAAAASPKYDKPRTGNTSLSLSVGAEWGDRHCPLLHLTSALYFIYGKRNSTELSIQIKKILSQIL